jgi:hypothetical protein
MREIIIIIWVEMACQIGDLTRRYLVSMTRLYSAFFLWKGPTDQIIGLLCTRNMTTYVVLSKEMTFWGQALTMFLKSSNAPKAVKLSALNNFST